MNARIGPAIVVGALAWTMMLSVPAASASATTKQQQVYADTVDVTPRRPTRHVISMRRTLVEPPHYYARPVYYRPYPYRVPAPFVFGYGPW